MSSTGLGRNIIDKFLNLCISVASLIPMKVRAGGFYTDGGKWLRIIRNKKDRLIKVDLFNLKEI